MIKYLNLIEQGNFEEARKYRKSLVPDKLTKFVSLSDDINMNEKKLKTLSEEKIWVSSVSELNDPYEFNCLYINKQKFIENDYDPKLIEHFENMLNDMKKEYGIVSLTANSFNSLPMWAYYANNYQGYCIEYEVIRNDAIFQVQYEPERIPIASIISYFLNDFINMRKQGKLTDPSVEKYVYFLEIQLFLKHESWKHENEYRIIYPLTDNIYDVTGAVNGKLISISDVGLKTKRIIVGYNCKKENINKLNNISKKLNCEIVQIKTSKEKYILLEETHNGQNEI